MNEPAFRPDADLPPALDADTVARLRRELDPDGRHDIIGRIMRTYETSLVSMMARLTDARQRADLKDLGEAAHKMKSSSASVGALVLAARCTALEQAVREGRPFDMGAEVEALLTEGGRVLSAVRAMLHA